jgi:adenosine/AMP kinase
MTKWSEGSVTFGVLGVVRDGFAEERLEGDEGRLERQNLKRYQRNDNRDMRA